MKAEPSSKSPKRDTIYATGDKLDKELNDGLLALAKALEVNAAELVRHIVRLIESYEKRNPLGPLMEVTNRLDALGIGLRRLQQQMLKQKELRKSSAAKKKNQTDRISLLEKSSSDTNRSSPNRT